MSEQKPEAVWIFPEEKKRRGGRIALVIGLVVAALIAAAVVALFLIPHGPGPVATPTPSVSTSASASPTPTPSPVPTVSPTGLPTAPVTSPPPVPDPSVDQFRAQVQQPLDDASTGLDIVQSQSGDSAAQTVDSLQIDAQNLAEKPAPSSIAEAWSTDVNTYSAKLQALRSAYGTGSDTSGALADARAALAQLRALVGL
jgi:hypothetical protein